MEIEETIPGSQNLTIMSTALVRRVEQEEDQKKSDFLQEQFTRIAGIYFAESFKQAVRANRSKNNGVRQKLPDIRKEVTIIASLAVLAAKAEGVPLLHIKKVKDIQTVIRSAAGIVRIEQWLQKNRANGELLLKASGNERLVNVLLDLRCDDSTYQHYFESILSLKKITEDTLEWLTVVTALDKNMGEQPRSIRLAAATANGFTWRKEEVYRTLIVGISLGVNQVEFSIKDLQTLCTMTRQDTWFDEISKKLNSISITELQKSLFELKGVRDVVEQMNTPGNKHIFYYLKKVSLKGNDDKELHHAYKLFMKAAGMLSGFRRFTFDHHNEQMLKDRITTAFSHQTNDNAYKFLLEYPYILPFLHDREVLRMVIIDELKENKLASFDKAYGAHGVVKTQIDRIDQQVSYREVIKNLMFQQQVLGEKPQFFTETRRVTIARGKTFRGVPITKALHRNICSHIAQALPPDQFIAWVEQTEKGAAIKGVQFEDFNSDYFAMLSLAIDTTRYPNHLSSFIRTLWWAKFIDDPISMEFFKKEERRLTEIFFKEKKKTKKTKTEEPVIVVQ